MHTSKTTPKDFFVWLGIISTLYWSVVVFLRLMFQYIDSAFGTQNLFQSDPYQSGVSFEMASLIVLFPIFLTLMFVIRKDIDTEPAKESIWVRKWALVLTLFLAGITMTVDLITLLNAFLSGNEIITPLILKISVVFLVSAALFMHFLADLRGYWKEYAVKARSIGYASAALVALTIIAGFFIIGTPQHARLLRYDAQKISDLQTIESRVTSYTQQYQKLPPTIASLTVMGPLPMDPQSGSQYVFQTMSTSTYKLCAHFNDIGSANIYGPSYPGAYAQDDWQHEAGNSCFIRSTTQNPAFMNVPQQKP